nr:MAG TPA: hypothetical protein [Microviridae sp.]
MNKMIIEDIVPENGKQDIAVREAVREQEHIPHITTVDTVLTDNIENKPEESLKSDERPKRGRGRPKIAPEMRKRTNGRFYVKLYLAYPSADQVARLRNMAKAFNKINEMRFARLLKIANSPSEAAQMVAAIGEEKMKIERRYRVWLRQKTRRDKEIEDKTFRQTVRALSKAIKNSRPVADK